MRHKEESQPITALTGVDWQLKPFDALSPHELYELMRLRQAVFVVEQNCPYGDLDGIDQKCLHLAGWHDQKPIAYLRIVPPEIHDSGCPSIGRICTSQAARRYGAGRELVKRGLEVVDQRYPGMPCQIGAQSYLRKFYESFGFVVDGEQYDEDGIPHFPMRRAAVSK